MDGYMLWLTHTLTHRNDPHADCIACFPPQDTPHVIVRGLTGMPGHPFTRVIEQGFVERSSDFDPPGAKAFPTWLDEQLRQEAHGWVQGYTGLLDCSGTSYTEDDMIQAWRAGYDQRADEE